MNRLLLLATAALLALPTKAQPLQTLYYKNGQKALEGRWTYQNLPDVLTAIAQNQHLDDHKPLQQSEDVFSHLTNRFESHSIPSGLRFDGRVVAYYTNGKERTVTTFRDGVPNGPYAQHYPNGKVAEHGEFQSGMPTGTWQVFYPSGQLYYRGAYRPFSQEEAQAVWQTFLLSEETSYTHSNNAQYREDSLQQDTTNVGHATARARSLFAYHLRRLHPQGVRDSIFTFYNLDGRLVAQVGYAEGVRNGRWQLWSDAGKLLHALQYEASRVTAAGDSGEALLPISAYGTRWRQRAESTSRAYKAQAVAEQRSRLKAEAAPDQPPRFPSDLNSYISSNLNYPEAAREAGIQGQVVAQFMVETDGSLTGLKIIKSVGGGCDEEVLRLVRAMPRWKPALMDGKPVRAPYKMPVQFNLD